MSSTPEGRWERYLSETSRAYGFSPPSGGTSISIAAQKVRLLTISILYASCLIYSYIYYLSPVWAYMGYPPYNAERSQTALIFSVFIIGILSLSMKPVIRTYSNFVSWFLFFFLYIPMTIIVSMQGLEDDGGLVLILSIAAAFTLIAFLPETIQAGRQKERGRSLRVRYDKAVGHRTPAFGPFSIIMISLYIALSSVTLVYFGSMMRIANFYEVYDQRAIFASISGNGDLVSYVLQWLIRLFAPFMLAVGIMYRRKLFAILGLATFLMGYAIQGAKYIPVLIALMLIFHYFILSRNEIRAERIGLVALMGLFSPLLIISVYGITISDSLDILLSQGIKRMFGTSGMTIGLYSQFFHYNHLTYYSHVGLISHFIEYPYPLPIGRMVGWSTIGNTSYNASANFLATDGVAALGYIGIVVIGGILGIILSAMNSWASGEDLRLLCLSSLSAVWTLVDSSLFSTMLSGGWPLFFLFVHFYLKEQRGRILQVARLQSW
ncbi:MAG: hypothetical protein WA973_18640 [Mesorhizobium sp.]